MTSDIVSDAKSWLDVRNGRVSKHGENCHQWHAECLVARLVAEVERHRMTEEEGNAAIDRLAADLAAVKASVVGREAWSQTPEWLPREIADKLRECDREAALRGCNDTGFPRLWFSAIWRSARLDFLGTLRETGRHPNDSSILSRADRAFHSPALYEARQQSFELQQEVKYLAAEVTSLTAEVERHRTTPEERESASNIVESDSVTGVLKLWIVQRNDDRAGYMDYLGFVCAAETEDEARKMHPSGDDANWEAREDFSEGNWHYIPTRWVDSDNAKKLSVRMIGNAHNVKPGVLFTETQGD